LALAASVPPERLTEVAEATAVAVPPQVLLRLGDEATIMPEGKLSVKLTPVSATPVFGLVMLNVRVVVPLTGIDGAPNSLVIVGAEATVRFAVAVFPVPPLVDVTAPVVFVY